MKKRIIASVSLVYVFYCLSLNHEQSSAIGKKIWYNECKGSIQGLTSWNEGEEFASLGIGHFIWCPRANACPFSETFPSLITFLKKKGAQVPSWIKPGSGCPWKTRNEFLNEIHSPRMNELRTFLVNTIDLQTEFIIERLNSSLPNMINASAPVKRLHIKNQFDRLRKTQQGTFALIDYVNFKGTGESVKERYRSQGWGLLQVLQRMKGTDPQTASAEFVVHAKELLTKRIENSPKYRNEQRWLAGWKNRLDSYLIA